MEIKYTTELQTPGDLFSLYQCLGWSDGLQLNQEQLIKVVEQSWYLVYAYDKEKLVGTGRVVSDGIIHAYLCGLGVDTNYRNKGIGTEIGKRLMEYCKGKNLNDIQLFCKEEIVPFYKNIGFEIFSIGMKVERK